MSEPKRTEAPKDTRTDSQRIADLELALAQTRAGLPGGTLPEHSAGYGGEVEETWSQQQQEQAYAEANDLTYPYHPATSKPGQGPK